MKTFFPEVKQPIAFEGLESDNPLAFRYYDPKRVIRGKTMEEHLRFSVAYWHTFGGEGADMFGSGAWVREWNEGSPMEQAEAALRASFEFAVKLGAPFYCFHDRDIAPEGKDFAESCDNLAHIVSLAERLQNDTGLKLLWGTANLFSHPRFTHGAATNPDPHVVAHAAAQVKHAMDATLKLGGENYVFWGGREGYETLLNTDMKQEQDQLARFFHMAVDYARKIGFKGTFLIEPKPKEPTKHQYDFDAATVLNFLRTYDLLDHFKLNIEANHATLAGHTFEHELTVAANAGRLGSIDANTGDMLLGWDTDQFPTNLYSTTFAMLVILRSGGLGTGGTNFDAKLRRGSHERIDLFHAHVGAMDTFARGLLVADRLLEDGPLDTFVTERYAGFKEGIGAEIMSGACTFDRLDAWIREHGEPSPRSGRQEMLENIVNRYLS